jgi:hypothetical protein
MRRRVVVWAIAVVCVAPAVPAGAAGSDTPAHMRAVVREWSKHLNAGDNRGLARLFSYPAIVIQGGLVFRIPTPAGVALWHEGLPCSGRVVAIQVRGRFATAVFVLGNGRPGKRCDAPGAKAAARFEIVSGKIRSWEQVPVPAPPPGASAS